MLVAIQFIYDLALPYHVFHIQKHIRELRNAERMVCISPWHVQFVYLKITILIEVVQSAHNMLDDYIPNSSV